GRQIWCCVKPASRRSAAFEMVRPLSDASSTDRFSSPNANERWSTYTSLIVIGYAGLQLRPKSPRLLDITLVLGSEFGTHQTFFFLARRKIQHDECVEEEDKRPGLRLKEERQRSNHCEIDQVQKKGSFVHTAVPRVNVPVCCRACGGSVCLSQSSTNARLILRVDVFGNSWKRTTVLEGRL